MHLSIRSRAALVASVLAALLATAEARASNYYEASPAGPITAATGSLRFSGGNLNIECEVTLTGSIPEGTLEGTTGAQIGQITGVTVPRCNTGSVTATPGLPWSLNYERELGTPPLITGLGLILSGLAISFSLPNGRRCEYSGSVPLLLALTGSEQFETGALSVAAGAQLHRTAGGCGCPPSVTLSGTFSFTRQVVRANVSWVLSMGDSFISGEAGRWAGNTDLESETTDALGPTAYFDNVAGTAELVNRCHRSRSAEIQIGVANVGTGNLACSGAKTYTFWARDPIVPTTRYPKPGMDWSREDITGQVGILRAFLERHQRGLRMIIVSIGGNDFNFREILQQCLTEYLSLPAPRYCSDRAEVLANFSDANVNTVTGRITQALRNVQQVVAEKGVPAGTYKIVVQNYPSPLPEEGGRYRYPETLARQTTGGCGVYNRDARWANEVALARINLAVNTAIINANLGATADILDVSRAFLGHRLCELGTTWLVEELGLARWDQNPEFAANFSEWVNQIHTLETIFEPYYLQEGLHPNYWGQLALRNCARLVYNNGNIRGGWCHYAGAGLNNQNPREPLMRIDATP